MSHPVWVRGLKQNRIYHHLVQYQSHPVWVRGLKHLFKTRQFYGRVAPRVGAWIETAGLSRAETATESHPVWVRGLKLNLNTNDEYQGSRTPCGCVD